MSNEQNLISNIIKIEYLTTKNAKFSLTKNGFLILAATVPNPEKENTVEEVTFDRVYLHRAFPYDDPYQFISVQGSFPKPPKKNNDADKDNKDKKDTKDSTKDTKDKGKKEIEKGDIREIGMIADINDFSQQVQEYIKKELERKYFTPVIKKINSIKEKYGYSYWVIETDVGDMKFTIHDTYRNILKVTDDRLFISDINGNRYEIPSLLQFDKNSYKKIEIYL